MQPQRDSVPKNSIPKVDGALPPGTLQRTLAIIMGGGAGTRLFPLTKDRAKPAVPLGGKYRIVDIPISNCLNSGLRSIYVLTQFNSMSLHRHIQASYSSIIFRAALWTFSPLNKRLLAHNGIRGLPTRYGKTCATFSNGRMIIISS